MVIGIIYGTLIGAVIIFAPAQLHSFPFLMVNAYLLATCAMCFVIRVTHQKSLINMFRFQYHVEQENQSLQKLSDQLKHVVDNQSLEIEKSELMLNTLLDNASDGVIIMSGEGRIIEADPSACKLYGYASSQLVGKKIGTVTKSNDAAFWERRLAYLKRDPHLLFEIDHVRDDNARVICEVSANRIQIGDVDVVLALYRDLSERRKMQEQLLLSQKMESIGTLSCGIAHDFRNVLATVQTFCDFIRTIKQDGPYCPAHESVVSSADLMEGELLRASEMLRKLLSFGGKTALEYVWARALGEFRCNDHLRRQLPGPHPNHAPGDIPRVPVQY